MPPVTVTLLVLLGCCPLGRGNQNGYLFISSPGEKTIYSSRLLTAPEMSRGEEMKKETLVQGGRLVEPSGLAIDSFRGLLYVADPGAEAVFVIKVFEEGLNLRSNPKVGMNGEPKVLLSGVASRWVAVDSMGAVLCSVANGDRIWMVPGKVAAAVADGEEPAQAAGGKTSSSVELFSGSTPSLKNVQGLASAGGRAYWANGASGKTDGTVASAVIDPTDERRHLTAMPQVKDVAAASGICLSNSHIFYTDGTKSLYSVPFSGGAARPSTISSDFQEARGCAYDGDGSIFVADAEAGKVYAVSAGSAMGGQRPLELAVGGVPGSYGLAVMIAYAHRFRMASVTVIIVAAAAAVSAS